MATPLSLSIAATGREPNRCRCGDGRALQRPCRRSILASRPASASRLARLWPGDEAVDRGQRGAHAGGQRLVVRAALDRVDPHDRVGRAVQARHLAPDELVVLALPAVGGDQHHRAAGQRAAPPDVVVALQRRADARPAGPVDDAVGARAPAPARGRACAARRSGASGACRRRRPRRRARSGPSRAGRAAARGCRAPSSPTRRTARRACAASACAGESAGGPGRRRWRSRRAPGARMSRTRPRRCARSRCERRVGRVGDHLGDQRARRRQLLGRHGREVLVAQHLVGAVADAVGLAVGRRRLAARRAGRGARAWRPCASSADRPRGAPARARRGAGTTRRRRGRRARGPRAGRRAWCAASSRRRPGG